MKLLIMWWNKLTLSNASFPLGDHSREADTQRGADSQAAARGAALSRLDLTHMLGQF